MTQRTGMANMFSLGYIWDGKTGLGVMGFYMTEGLIQCHIPSPPPPI